MLSPMARMAGRGAALYRVRTRRVITPIMKTILAAAAGRIHHRTMSPPSNWQDACSHECGMAYYYRKKEMADWDCSVCGTRRGDNGRDCAHDCRALRALHP